MLNRLFPSTFENALFGISNVGLVGELRARLVVVWTKLRSHFLVVDKLAFNFLRILILGLDLNWRNVRLRDLVLHYIKLQVLRLFELF